MVSNRRSLVALKASWLIKVIGQAEAAVGAKFRSRDHFVQPFIMATYFPIGQAAVAASEESSSYINYFSKFYLRGFP